MCDRIRRGGHCPPVFFVPPFFSFSFGERKEPPSRQKKPAPFRFRLTAKVPHPQSPSSFPKADRRAGSQFGFGGFRRAARYLDDGGHLTFHRYGSQGRREIEGAEKGTSGPRRFLFYAFFRFQGWKETSHATTLYGMATNMSRIECCLTKTVEMQMSTPSGIMTHCKCRLRSPGDSQQAATRPTQPMTCMLGQTLVFVSAA